MSAFTDPTSLTAINTPTCIDELVAAYNERALAAGAFPAPITRADWFPDAQNGAASFQQVLEYLVGYYVNHTAGSPAGDFSGLADVPMWTMEDIWTAIGRTGWRRYADKPEAVGGTVQYGYIQSGDCIDPSFYKDCQAVLKLLQWCPVSLKWGGGATYGQTGGMGGAQATWAAAVAAAQALYPTLTFDASKPRIFSRGLHTGAGADPWVVLDMERSYGYLSSTVLPVLPKACGLDVYFNVLAYGAFYGGGDAVGGTMLTAYNAGIGKLWCTASYDGLGLTTALAILGGNAAAVSNPPEVDEPAVGGYTEKGYTLAGGSYVLHAADAFGYTD